MHKIENERNLIMKNTRFAKRIAGLLCCVFLISLFVAPASAAGLDGAVLAQPVLSGTARVERTDVETETLLTSYTDAEVFLTEEVHRQLDDLQLQCETPYQAQMIQDNILDRDVTRLTFDTYQADIDQNGQIVSMMNFAALHDNDGTILAGVDTVTDAYPFTKEDALALAEKFEHEYQLDDYQLVNCSNDIPATWLLVWHNRMENGVLNPYDVVTITVDARDGSIMLMNRNTATPAVTETLVTESGAVRRAQPVRQKLGNPDIQSVERTVFRPNFYWESAETLYEEADFVRQAWCVTFADGSTVYIDTQTGETLGGSQAMAVYGRSVSAVPYFYQVSVCVSLAKTAFERVGYTHHLNTVNYWIEQGDIEYILNRSNLKGLYLSCHGSPNSQAISDDENWYIHYSQINGGYTFVFLDACWTSLEGYFASAFLGDNYTGKCFVGWNVPVMAKDAYAFNCHFWSRVGYRTVLDAVLTARSMSLSEGYTTCNPGFRGDSSTYGRAA